MRISPLILVLFFIIPLLCSCESGIYHTVTKGQTLYRISRTYQVNEDYLARVNGITDPAQLRIGTRLFIPGAQKARSVSVVQPVAKNSPKPVAATVKKKSASQPPTKKTAIKSSKTEKTASKNVTARANRPSLHWPLRGKIARTFSGKTRTGGGKGIEIAVRSGSPVSAAEAGKVIYSGDGVRGYGYLIIVQHENDLFTVYGFNQKNFVKQGDFVSKGERIALSGTPPGGGSPRLHFEVRNGKVARDPLLYLP